MAGRTSEWRLQTGQYLGEISALCFLHPPPSLSCLPYLLAGTGSQLLLYDLVTGVMIRSFQVFEGIRVHGISLEKFHQQSSSSTLAVKIAVFGERKVKIFCLRVEIVNNSQNKPQVSMVDLILLLSLPKLNHWVLDVRFLKDSVSSSHEESQYLAVGCSDNTVCFWNILRSDFIFEVRCSEKCLLYSMRMWGDEVEALRVASGTIYNEVIVWKVVRQNHAPFVESAVKDLMNPTSEEGEDLPGQQYEALHICKMLGHEGSIFRIAWSSNGSRLVSVSDDRSARIWAVHAERSGAENSVGDDVSYSMGPVLFGHTARVWDCCIFDSLIITAGEDCTCRLWQLDGTQLRMIKDHIGRGIWRCLYDPNSSLLVTAGFDSAIKVHEVHASISEGSERCIEAGEDFSDSSEIFTLRIPNSSEHIGLMDSKSEYVRCLHFTREDILYVATNNGHLYHAKLSTAGDVKWTKLVRVSGEVPIVCMNLISTNSSDICHGIDDWVAVGDGKGSMTIVRVVGNVWRPKVGLVFTWSAEIGRQLLGTYWCRSLGFSFIFSADPKGKLKLWRLCDPLQTASDNNTGSHNATLVAEFVSCFGVRIVCLDASLKEEVLVCGDLRGNLILFPLLKGLLLGSYIASEAKISPSNHFKGAHGISSVCSVAIAGSSFSQVEIHSTGADGCICCLEYDRDQQTLEFIGMKQVKELSLVQSIFSGANSYDHLASGNYAVGFAASDFKVWNLITETKALHISCGGWRRPHSYYLGDVPEIKNCFAFVKDDIIYVHRHWVPEIERRIYPQNLHLQFHGREMHSLCFISECSQFSSNEKQCPFSRSGWIATGCEDGTVRLTRYDPGVEKWSASKLLGEHVGGSAVRSICTVSKIHMIAPDLESMPNGTYRRSMTSEDQENPFLLISVGAKRVITAWKRKFDMTSKKKEDLSAGPDNGTEKGVHFSEEFSLMSFQWISTNMPTRNCSIRGKGQNIEKEVETAENICTKNADATSESHFSEMDSKPCLVDKKYEDDWRHLAVTAFLVKVFGSRISVCFVVVACSDATVALRALILPYRLWFDVALLVPLSSPVLALQHVVIPKHLEKPSKNNNSSSFEDQIQNGSLYLLISGCTDGSIVFWDLTDNVENFMRQVLAHKMENYIDCQKRPRTGRGSQGGRWWRSLGSHVLKKKPGEVLVPLKATLETDDNMHIHGSSSNLSRSQKSAPTCSQARPPTSLGSGASADDLSLEISKIWPLHVLYNIHQSGVNCLHVSVMKDSRVSKSGFLYYVMSGGDDQALHCLRFDLALQPSNSYPPNFTSEMQSITALESTENCTSHCQKQKYGIRFLSHDKVISAHSSAIKGVWTDGSWVFSAGLDQRVRCWHIEQHGKLTEHTHLVISVPEPEALDARACGRNHYQIVVAGRGMQMVEFFGPAGMDDEESGSIC